MKIQIFNQNIDLIASQVTQTIEHVLSQVGDDVKIEDVQYDLDLILKFKIEGRDEYQVVSTDREIFGMAELYTIRPIFTEDGTMITDNILDNKEETFETVAMSLDKELPTEAIVSEFVDTDIADVINEFSSPDGAIVERLVRLNDDTMVLQYFRGGVGLVHELHLTEKPENYEGPNIIDATYEEVVEEVEEVIEYPSCGFSKCETCE